MSAVCSSLAPLASVARDPDPDRAWRAAQAAWKKRGILVLNPIEIEARAGWVAARMARNLGEQLYGKRKGANDGDAAG